MVETRLPMLIARMPNANCLLHSKIQSYKAREKSEKDFQRTFQAGKNAKKALRSIWVNNQLNRR